MSGSLVPVPDHSILARSLGPRGSRAPVGHDDPAGDPGDAAHAVLAGVPAWWDAAALAAGLDGSWLGLETAIGGLAPAPQAAHPADLAGLTGFDVGAKYVVALAVSTRSRHGRHYTPAPLAGHLWAMAHLALGQRGPGLSLPGLVRDPACGAGALLLPPSVST